LRISGGEARGRKLKTPRGRRLRPTLSRVREALFDMLAPRLEGARFLDLFAGVGAVGLEAASRGAAQVVLVEAAPRNARLVQENLEALGLADRARVIRSAARTALLALAERGECFHLVFMDPPYHRPEAILAILELIAQAPALLCPGGVVVAQHDFRLVLPEAVGACRQVRTRRFGDTSLTFYQLYGPQGGA